MDLWEVVRKGDSRSVAVFGMAKNAGKTVALNYLSGQAGREILVLGMTSIGRDGEPWDVLTHRRKPSIEVREGTLVATAEACLGMGTADLEVLDTTDIATPLGPVLVARARRPGRVELAGPSRSERLRRIVGRLHDRGADLVLVDGAVDRRGLASPRVTEASVLATGAVLSEDRDEVVRRTRDRVRQLTLPRAPEALRRAWRAGRVVVRVGDRTTTLETPAALQGDCGVQRLVRGHEAEILVGGALTEPLLREMIGERVRVVVRDATCLFADQGLLRRLARSGGSVEVVDPVRLVAVTVNPHAPGGWSFDAGVLFRAVRTALPDVPVFDVVSGLGPAS